MAWDQRVAGIADLHNRCEIYEMASDLSQHLDDCVLLRSTPVGFLTG